jgi:hypothetical protein
MPLRITSGRPSPGGTLRTDAVYCQRLSRRVLTAFTHLREAIASAIYRPCLQLPLRRPLGPPDPGAPPCTRQRRLPVTAGDRHRRCVGSCTEIGFGAFQSVAPALGVEVSSIGMSATREIESALATLARAPNAGLIVTDSASAQLYRELIITLADRHKLPAPGTMPSAPGIACVMDRCSTQRAPLFTARRSGHSRPRKCLRNGRLAARDDRARNAGQERKAGDKDGWRLTCDLLEIIEVELGKLKEPNHRHRRLLRARRERPRSRAADQRDDLAPLHAIHAGSLSAVRAANHHTSKATVMRRRFAASPVCRWKGRPVLGADLNSSCVQGDAVTSKGRDARFKKVE